MGRFFLPEEAVKTRLLKDFYVQEAWAIQNESIAGNESYILIYEKVPIAPSSLVKKAGKQRYQ
jgi:hypothetical protein